ncbi:MAG TPA: cyclic nucleotide-binding domain-containing protein [Polyangiaceae bacterium]|jgi:CRP-like cAMP-binding protein|nr:cyclic nucleotide-binding domain-containing protein [Polyangiaceae bacterium]
MSDDLRIVPSVASGVRDRLLAVRTLGILHGLDDDGALLLAEYSKLSFFEPEQEVTSADADAESVHVVLEGRLRVPRPDGSSIIIDNGRGVGVIGVLANTGKGFQSIAEVPTRTLEISKEAFLTALDESFSIARNVLKIFAGTLLDDRGTLPTLQDAIPSPSIIEDRTEPRTLVERVIEVSRTGIFTDANIDPIFDIARVMRQIRVPVWHVFFKEGDLPRVIIRVLGGTVRCTKADGAAVEVSSGHMLGGLAALAARKHGFEAKATTEVVAYEINFEDFLVVLEAHPELSMKMLQTLARTLLEPA